LWISGNSGVSSYRTPLTVRLPVPPTTSSRRWPRVLARLAMLSAKRVPSSSVRLGPIAETTTSWFAATPALSRQVELRRLADEGKTGLLLPPLTHADIGI
jgi:hypothetical protein